MSVMAKDTSTFARVALALVFLTRLSITSCQQAPIPESGLQCVTDPCECTMSGISGMASVGLDQTGCHWLSTHRDTTYCYVVEPVNCEGVIPSLDYIGAGFRQCNVTEDPEGVMNDEPVLSVLEIIEGTPQLCTFAEALRAANLSDTLEEGNWTIFAPHNNAFRMFFDSTGETKESLLASPGLAKLLRAHIAPGTFTEKVLRSLSESGGGVETLSSPISNLIYPVSHNTQLSHISQAQVIMLNNAAYGEGGAISGTITTAAAPAVNGQIYMIRNVLAVPGPVTSSVSQIHAFSVFSSALQITGVQGMISQDCPSNDEQLCAFMPLTVFAPTNAAFTNLAHELGTTVDELLHLPEMADIVLYHITDPDIITDVVYPGDLETGMELATLYPDANISVVATDGRIPILTDPFTGSEIVADFTVVGLAGVGNDSEAVLASDAPLVSYNGITIAIDSVLLPYDISPAPPSSPSAPILV